MMPGDPAADALADSLVDAALRAVAVPADLGERLRPERLFADDALDRMLGDVALPLGLAGRLRPPAAVAPARALAGPMAAPARRAAGRRWWRTLARDGMAVACSLGFVAAMFWGGLWITDTTTQATAGRQIVGRPATPAGRPAEASGGQPGPGPAVTPHEGDLSAPQDAVARASPQVVARRTEAVVVGEGARRDAPPLIRTAPLVGDGSRPAAEGMRIVPDDSVGGVRRAVPTMRGYDLAFEMAHGEPPFIEPAIAPGLAVDRPPLVVATDSFDRVWPLPRGRRRLAEIEQLRAEHLIASMSSAPAASGGGKPALDLAAVRSIRPGRPTYLVECRVTVPVAPADEPSPFGPVDVTAVLDHSAGPEALPLWQAACRGLASAMDRLGPADRVTVIVAEPRPRRVAIRATAPEVRRLCDELEEEPPFGSADLDAAVALAREPSESGGSAQRLVVVAHAERAERCAGAAGAALQRWRVALAAGQDDAAPHPRFVLVSGISDGSDADALAGVPGWTLSDPTMVRRRCAALVAGQPQVVAEDVVLEVRFDPRTIAAYRLVGHRQNVAESLAAFGTRSSTAASRAVAGGETVRVVYEVVPRDQPAERIAGVDATLSYREPAGRVRVVRASGSAVEALGGVPSPRACELLLAVGIGDAAARSVHAPPRRVAIERLQELASGWQRRGDVTVAGERLIGVLGDIAGADGGLPR